MLKLSAPLTGLAILCTSLSLTAAPVPTGSLAGKTFILKGETFQAKFAITDDGLGKIWRPDGYSTIHWTTADDKLVATLDTPLESPYQGADAQGNPVTGVTRLETLTIVFAEGQALVADVKETYRDIFPPESGVPEAIEEYDNAALPFVNYSSLKPLAVATGSLLALPLSADQSAIIKLSDATQATLVEDPLNKAPSTFAWTSVDSLTLKLDAASSIRYSVLESQGLSSVLLAEVKKDGKETIFLSAGGNVDPSAYQTPATVVDFTGTYTVPEFFGTDYIFAADGIGKIVNKAADGTVTTNILTWGIQEGTVFGHRWTQMIDSVPTPVTDASIAAQCEAGTLVCEMAQSRSYKVLAKTPTQIMVLRVLDQKVTDGLSTWIHVFNRSAR